MDMNEKEIYDDDVIIIGGSEWKPGNTGGEDLPEAGRGSKGNGARGRWKAAAIAMGACLVLLSGFLAVKHFYYTSRFPKSRPDKEVIAMLGKRMPGQSGVQFTRGSAMGVELNVYGLSGLQAHFADTVPDISDTVVYLVTRSADYMIRNDARAIIGDFVQDGEVLARSRWRAGFLAVADGNAVIGISRGDRIRRHVLEHDGSFFRQLAIVSAGVRCDSQYILKGKVTRCAYARDEAGKLYFVETVSPETLYGFADALIEYGFVDAVYVTGGRQPELFYRDAEGAPHGSYIDDKPHKLVVWTGRL